MPFPFTFNLSVPGLFNPFSPPPLYTDQNHAGRSIISASTNPEATRNSDSDRLNITAGSDRNNAHGHKRKPSPLGDRRSPDSSRKRGWEPSFSEPSQSMPTLASSSGYLDTPAKYREMAEQKEGLTAYHGEVSGAADQQQPPAKRRRGLAGSIVSTAVSAALIGTAVGLTVYRLWRDRGKDAEPPLITVGTEAGPNTSSSPPPPPYSSSDPQAPPSLNVVPPTPRSTPRKTRQHQAHSSARKRPRRVPHQSLHNINSFGPGPSNSNPVFPPTQAAFDFTSPHRRNIPTTPSDDEAETADDQMDWIGSKLTSLIEEGRKALGREVVVMSESKEDEVDDGSGEWVEEEGVDEFGTRIGGRPRGRSNAGSGSRSGSRRTPGSANASLGRRAGAAAAAGMTINAPSSVNFTGSSTSYSASTSPRESQFDLNAGLSSSLPNTLHGMGPGSSVRHDSESSWQSPELRETMERARAQARERRTNLGTASSSPTSFSFS